MSAAAAAASNNNNSSNSMAEVDDVNMFQAARRNGRRNAMGDLGEQLSQVSSSIATAEVDNLTPHLQSMSIKH